MIRNRALTATSLPKAGTAYSGNVVAPFLQTLRLAWQITIRICRHRLVALRPPRLLCNPLGPLIATARVVRTTARLRRCQALADHCLHNTSKPSVYKRLQPIRPSDCVAIARANNQSDPLIGGARSLCQSLTILSLLCVI